MGADASSGAPVTYDHSTAPVARASQVGPGAVTIDGKLDEAAWATAEAVTRFTQFDPKEGEPATQRTEVRILIDGEAIYFGARMFESDPAKLRPRLARRDEPVDGDVVAITLDSPHDHLSGYFFRVTAGGAVRDAVATHRVAAVQERHGEVRAIQIWKGRARRVRVAAGECGGDQGDVLVANVRRAKGQGVERRRPPRGRPRRCRLIR